MKKKNVSVLRNRGQNAHYFGNSQAEIYARNFGFFEGRLLNQTGTPPEKGPDTTAEAATPGHKNAVAMIKAVHDLKGNGVEVDDIPGSDNPEDILKDNPFKDALYSISPLCDVTAGNLSLNGATDDRAKGVFTLKFSPGGAMNKFDIPGDAYIALMWQKIGPLVKERFARQITNPATLNAVITKAAEVKKPSFMAMVKAMATSENPDIIDAKLVTDALIELQALDPEALKKLKANADAVKKLEELKGSPGFEEANVQFQQAEKVRKENEQFDQIDKIRKQMEHLQKNMTGNLAYWRMSVAGGSEEIDPKRWDCTTKPGIAEIQKDWRTLGIYAQSPAEFLDGVILAKFSETSADPDFVGKQSPEKKQIYLNPLANIDKLNQLGDPVFAESVKFFEKMKEIAEKHDQYRKDYTETHQNYGEEPITATLGKALRDNGKAFMDALHNKDWTTAGAYVLGVWAMYRAYKSLPPAKQETYSKWAFRGAAIYAAHIFAKNAGYNVLEKLGIKDLGYELANTSLDVLYEVLPELRNVPPRVINATAMTNIGDLYKRYKMTNEDNKRQWIDPAKFRTEFPEFARMRVNDAFKQGTLNSKEKDYKDTGHQLYALVGGLEAAYNRIMKPHDSKNFLSFEDAVLKDATLSKSTILAFTIALRNYNVEDKSISKLLGAREISNLSKRMHTVFDKQDMGVNLESGMRPDHAINGTIMDFPVVFKRNTRDKTMLIVPRYVYEEKQGSFDATFDVIGKIPLEDIEVEEGLEESKPVSAAATASIAAMKQKLVDTMGRKIAVFRDHGGFLVNPQWKGGHWQAKMSFNRRLPSGAMEQPIDVYVIPTNNGKGLQVISTDPSKSAILVNIQNIEDDREAFGSVMLSHLVSQRSGGRAGVPDFTPLSWFNQKNKLLFRDGDPKDDFFEIRVGNVRIDGKEFIKIKMMTDGTFRFDDKDMEKKLLEHPAFQVELSGAIAEVEFEDLIKQWNDTIEATPQDFLFHFAGLFPNVFRKGTWGNMTRGVEAKFLTGSVPKNFTKALVKAQMSAIQAKFRLGMETAGSLEKVDDLRSSIMMGGKAGMANALKELQRMNRENEEEGKEFSEAGFQAVWENLIGATHKSNDYKGFYRAFMDKVFARYGIDDFSEGDALKASRLLEVFSYYTAVADNPEMDGANLNFELRVTATVKKHMEIIDGLDKEREQVKQPKATYADLLAKYLPAAGAPAGVSSAMTQAEFDDARKVLTEYMKLRAYNQNASYCGEVANRIMAKLSAEIRDGIPPGPGGAWRMPKYEEYLDKVPNGANELVDSTPPLKMSASYMTFDKWQKLRVTNSTEALKYNETNIYLPRQTQNLRLYEKAEFDMLQKILDRRDAVKAGREKPLLTELEEIYLNRVNEFADKIRKEYDGKGAKSELKRQNFDKDINDLMSKVDFQDNFSTPTAGRSGTDSKGGYVDVRIEPNSAISYQIEKMELTLSKGHRTMTKSDQDRLMDSYIREYFVARFLNEKSFDRYFERASIPKAIGEWLHDVKIFLFGW